MAAERSFIMKKLTVLLCTMALGFGLIACGKQADDNNQSSEPESSVVESSEGLVGEPIEDSTPVEEEPSIEAGTEMDEGIASIRDAVMAALGENYWPNTEMPVEFMDAYGLTADMYDAFFGEMPMISTNVDTLIVIKAKDGQVEAVEGVLNAYRDKLVNDTMQYPMNIGKIQASRVDTFGNYVCFIQLGADVMDAMDLGDEAVIKQCQEQNEIAASAISQVME